MAGHFPIGNLFSGAAHGFSIGQAIRGRKLEREEEERKRQQEANKAEIEKRKADLSSTKTVLDFLQPGQDPAILEAKIDAFMIGKGGDPDAPNNKRVKKLLMKVMAQEVLPFSWK